MKYLDDFPELSELSELLAYSSAELKVRTRFGAFVLARSRPVPEGRGCLADAIATRLHRPFLAALPSTSRIGTRSCGRLRARRPSSSRRLGLGLSEGRRQGESHARASGAYRPLAPSLGGAAADEPLPLACPSIHPPTSLPEVYSCKSVSRERKLFKSLEEAHSLEQQDLDNHMAFSPENRDATLDSCFGRLDQKDSRSVLAL